MDKAPIHKQFTQEEILGLIPAQAFLDIDRAKEVLEKVQETQRGADDEYYQPELTKLTDRCRELEAEKAQKQLCIDNLKRQLKELEQEIADKDKYENLQRR